MANMGTLLPAVEDRDWEALEKILSEQLDKGSVETNMQDIEDVVAEYSDDEVSSSSDVHEHESHTAMAVTTSSPINPISESTALEAPLCTSSESPATVSLTDLETNEDKVPSKVINASINASEVNFNVGELVFAHHLYLIIQQDYMDCVLDGDLASELSD